jgi:hypothetical protein
VGVVVAGIGLLDVGGVWRKNNKNNKLIYNILIGCTVKQRVECKMFCKSDKVK